jgi:hypothetical protein
VEGSAGDRNNGVTRAARSCCPRAVRRATG